MHLLSTKCSIDTVSATLASMGVGPHLNPANPPAINMAKSLNILAEIYKTQQCGVSLRGNICQKGLACNFAHGPAEQRSKEEVSLNQADF